jgi:hypothetical protein
MKKAVTIWIDEGIKQAAVAYVRDRREETLRYENFSSLIQELLKAKLERAGYWPPKAKEGK